jgi:hypothetical protein
MYVTSTLTAHSYDKTESTMTKKVEQYNLKIRDGDPPDKKKTVYDKKALPESLSDIADSIKQGQNVEVPSGSVGKLKRMLKRHGSKVVQRGSQIADCTIVYVPSEQWWDAHPKGR